MDAPIPTLATMKLALQASGAAFEDDEDMPPGLWLNLNDIFAWACADTEQVSDEDLPEVYAFHQAHGIDGTILWACKRRQMWPQPKLWQRKGEEKLVALLEAHAVPKGRNATFKTAYGVVKP